VIKQLLMILIISLSLLTMPQKFYLDESPLYAPVTFAWKCPAYYTGIKSTRALYTSVHYNWDITVSSNSYTTNFIHKLSYLHCFIQLLVLTESTVNIQHSNMTWVNIHY